MASYTSIQEFPSYEGSEASPTHHKVEAILERNTSESDNVAPPSYSARSFQKSPELKQCGDLCPSDQPKMFFLDNQLEKILQKTERTINEAVYVYKNIKNFEFFKSFKEKNKELQTTDALIHLCKVMKLETFFSDTIIYRKNDLSNNKVYLVFSGEVIVATANQAQKTAESNSNLSSRKFKTAKTMMMKSGQDEQGDLRRRTTRVKTERISKLTPKPSFGKDFDLRSGYSANEKKLILPSSMQDLKEELSVTKSRVRFDLTNFGADASDGISSDDDSKDSIERRLELENLEQAESNGFQTVREGSGVYDSDVNRNTANLEGSDKETAANAYRLQFERSPKATPIKPALKKTNSRTDNGVELKNSDVSSSGRKIIRASTVTVGLTEIENEKSQHDKTPKGASPKHFFTSKSFKNIIHSIAARPKVSSNTPTHSGSNPAARNLAAELEDDTSVYSNTSNLFNTSMRISNNLNAKMRDSEGFSGKANQSMNSFDGKQQEEKDIPKESHGIRKGGTFGEKVLTSNGPREETMMAKNYTKVLTFTLDEYDYITTRFERNNTSRLNFLLDHIPELEKALKYSNIKNVENYFDEKCFTLHNPVTREGDKGKFIYILYEGTCKVYKDPAEPEQAPNDERKTSRTNLETPRRKMEGAPNKILVSMIQPGAFIGEDIILHGVSNYQYTVKASSAAIRVLAIRKKVFKRVMPFEVIDGLKSLCKRRKAQNDAMLSQKLNIPSTISTQSRSKMNLLKRLNSGVQSKGYMRSYTNIQDDSLLQRNLLDSSIQEDVKEKILLRKSSQPVLTRSIQSLPVIPDDYEFGPVKKAGDLKSLLLGPAPSMRAPSQDKKLLQEIGTLDKTIVPSQNQVETTARAWNVGVQHIPFVPQKPTLKDQEAMLRKVEDEMDKVKGHYMKFSRAKVLDGIFKNEQTSFRNENSGILSPKNSTSVVRSTKNAGTRFPRIDSSDPKNLKFDFGKENEISVRRDFSGSQERFLLNRSRADTSPRSLNSLVKTISPKNSGFLKSILSTSTGASSVKAFGSTSARPAEVDKTAQSGDSKEQSRLFATTAMSFRGAKIKKDLRYGRSSERFEESRRTPIVKKKIVGLDIKRMKLDVSGVFPEVGVIGKQADKSGIGFEQV